MRSLSTWLETVLLANGGFCGLSGLAVLLGAAPIAAGLAVPTAVLVVLIAYGTLIIALASRASIVWLGRAVTALDVAWLVASAGFLALHAAPSPMLIWLQGVAVLLFVVVQVDALRRLMSQSD
jgi:hypothetical protein